jgi:hypothetical protein
VDGFNLLALRVGVACAVLGLTLGILAIVFSEKKSHATRVMMVAAGFLGPAVYTAYLLTAGYLRNVQAYRHGEAACRDGSCTVQLSHDYQLSYFDETPSLAQVLRASPWALQGNGVTPAIDRVNEIAADHGQALIAAGSQDLAFNAPNKFFALDLQSGKAMAFDSEDALRRATGFSSKLLRTDEFLADRENRARFAIFWPLVLIAPFLIVGLIVSGRSRRQVTN